jgi:hypothetical protein
MPNIRPFKNQTTKAEIRQMDYLLTPTVTAEIRFGTSYSLLHLCFTEMLHAKANQDVEHCGLLWQFA